MVASFTIINVSQLNAEVIVLDCKFLTKGYFLGKKYMEKIIPPTKKILFLNKKKKLLFTNQRVDCSNPDNCTYDESDTLIIFRYCPDGGCQNYSTSESRVVYALNRYNGDIVFNSFAKDDGIAVKGDMYYERGNCKQTSNKPKF